MIPAPAALLTLLTTLCTGLGVSASILRWRALAPVQASTVRQSTTYLRRTTARLSSRDTRSAGLYSRTGCGFTAVTFPRSTPQTAEPRLQKPTLVLEGFR